MDNPHDNSENIGTAEELDNLLHAHGVHNCRRGSRELSATAMAETANLIREIQEKYGTHSPTDETDSEANSRIQRFITQRLRAGQLVFDRHIAENDLDENFDEVSGALSVMLYAVERHATVIIPAKSSRNDGIKRQIFAAAPIPDRGILRRTRHRADIVAIATQAGFTQLRKP